jgi:HAD superfamily hydrolase (TIGR01459 family)
MTIAVYERMSGLEARFDGLILDVWGVVMDGTAPYPGARDCLAELHRRGKRVVLLSNAPRRESQVVQRLAEIGIAPGLYDRVVSSGEASRLALEARTDPGIAGLGRRYLYIGPERDRGLLDGLDYERSDVDDADFVLAVGIEDDSDGLDKYRPLLARAAKRGLAMICANPDRVVVRQTGERVLCAGALAEAYEGLGGRVHYFGKPHARIYDVCFERLGGLARERILAVGDNLETDIAGAQKVGLATVLVLGGVLAEPLGIAWGESAPPARIEALCAEHGIMPDLAIPALLW